MTSLALGDPPLRRLFGELDYAARAGSERLRQMSESWTALRGASLAPSWEEAQRAGFPASPWGFAFRAAAGRDYDRLHAGPQAEQLLGGSFAKLGSAPNRRMSVRLRRLFDAVLAAGEPVLARADRAGTKREDLEILVLPVSTAGGAVDAVVGGFAPEPRSQAAAGATRPAALRQARDDAPLIFALGASHDFGLAVAHALGCELSEYEERVFEDGEHKARPLRSVQGRCAIVVHSLHADETQSANDKLCRLLFFIGALKDSGVRRARVIAPYLCYARKDRRTKPNDPVSTRYVAQLFEAMGVDGVSTVEVHNPAAFENAFRIPKVHVSVQEVMLPYLLKAARGERLAVVSPDTGEMKRAEALRLALEEATGEAISKALMEKQRSQGEVWGDLFAGDVAGRTAVIVDDLISTGGSMARTVAECRKRGAARVLCVAAHGLFIGGASALFASDVDRVAVTNSVPLTADLMARHTDRIDVLDVSGAVATAAREAGWLSDLNH